MSCRQIPWLVLIALVAWGLVGQSTAVHARAEIISLSTEQVDLEVNKGKLIRLNRKAASVFIADPDVADIQVKSPTLVYVFGRKVGETSLYAVDKNDKVLANLHVAVNHNLTRLRRVLKNMLPNQDIKVRSVDGTILLSGTVDSAVAAADARDIARRFTGGDSEAVLNRLRVDSVNQVNLRVRIVEVTRSVIKELGINWEGIGQLGNFVLGLATGNDVVELVTDNILTNNTNFIDRTDSLIAGFDSTRLSIHTVIDALEKEGHVTTLAEPNLTAMSGQTASFLVGGEFPIPVAEENNSVAISFKEFGVSLAFTPTVIDGARINMRVRPEVSALSTAGAVQISSLVIPALATRRAETTVELGSGQSFAIAGLLKNETFQDFRKLPGIAELPILGRLFNYDRFNREESELVIIVTPYLVRPVSSQRLASPEQGKEPGTDAERLTTSTAYRPKIAAPMPAPVTPGGRRAIGPIGFELQ